MLRNQLVITLQKKTTAGEEHQTSWRMEVQGRRGERLREYASAEQMGRLEERVEGTILPFGSIHPPFRICCLQFSRGTIEGGANFPRRVLA